MRVKPGVYKHFKGHLISVIGEGHHTETKEEYVVYIHLGEGLYGTNDIWMRPKKMFLETVIRDGKTFKRFEYMGELK